MVLPFARNSDGSLITEYNFFAFEKAQKYFSLDVYGGLKTTEMAIRVLKCSSIITETKDIETITTQQISSDSISICVRAIDLDSGIKQVDIGIGSVYGGFELQAIKSAISSSHRMHDIVEANLTHGERVYIEAVVINHAGLQTEFTSHPFIIDHTPPIIQNMESSLEYRDDVRNDTTTRVHSRWQVMDDESDVKFCEYCIGFSESSCDIIGWTATSSLSVSQSTKFKVQHGNRIFLKLRCINGVQLSGYAYSGSLVVSYIPPEIIGSKIEFITDTGIRKGFDHGTNYIDWKDVFKPTYISSYQLAVGSSKGMTDILMPTTTTETRVAINIPREYHEIRGIVTATSITGLSTTYRQTIVL
ncbi:Hypothetical predicted protein [Mytilus galloprovincialis]|uniref:Uncharacterized protein n=1 Tax=Mytilus galloprovincialis TaxID=29158 RepID=A0A8B6D1J3_MYTGA|nr:Hypothetical predicted protein [Mytilus galloprovincialis]